MLIVFLKTNSEVESSVSFQLQIYESLLFMTALFYQVKEEKMHGCDDDRTQRYGCLLDFGGHSECRYGFLGNDQPEMGKFLN